MITRLRNERERGMFFYSFRVEGDAIASTTQRRRRFFFVVVVTMTATMKRKKSHFFFFFLFSRKRERQKKARLSLFRRILSPPSPSSLWLEDAVADADAGASAPKRTSAPTRGRRAAATTTAAMRSVRANDLFLFCFVLSFVPRITAYLHGIATSRARVTKSIDVLYELCVSKK